MKKSILVFLFAAMIISCGAGSKVQHGIITEKHIISGFNPVYVLTVTGYNQLTSEMDAESQIWVLPETYYTKNVGDAYDATGQQPQF